VTNYLPTTADYRLPVVGGSWEVVGPVVRRRFGLRGEFSGGVGWADYTNYMASAQGTGVLGELRGNYM
jgi:hypothetical protein